MKKEHIINLIIVIVVIALITGLVFLLINNNKDEFKNIKKLNINELKEKIDKKDSFVLVISKDDCTHCIAYLPVLDKVGSQYGLTFYDISTTNLSDEDKTYLRNIANISGTPTTIFIEDGVEKNTTNRLVGDTKEYRIIEKLKAMGYINE